LLTNEDGSLSDSGEKVIAGKSIQRFGQQEELTADLVYLPSDNSSFE